MFTRPREEALRNLKKMQQEACLYNNTPCDCKYGASGSREETGCPELRTVIKMLENMDDEQYNEILGREAISDKPRSEMSQYLVIKTGDGMSIEVLSAVELIERLNEDYWGENPDIIDLPNDNDPMGWGWSLIILKIDGNQSIIPELIKGEWKLPE